MWALLRMAIGGIFFVSGLEKSLSPYQNFLYAIQAYQLLPSRLELVVAQLFPWVELMLGLFVVLGLWTSLALRGALVLFGVFIVVVGQALLRGLPMDHCGCFGDLIHFSPRVIIVFDSASLLLTLFLLRYPAKAKQFSMDKRFHE